MESYVGSSQVTNYNSAKAEVLVYAFKCEMCSFCTKRKYDLKRHVMRKHSDVDVSFLCTLCDKTFQQAGAELGHT